MKIQAQVGDVLDFYFPGNPSTGYTWSHWFPIPWHAYSTCLIMKNYILDEGSNKPGGEILFHFPVEIAPCEPQTIRIVFMYSRTWTRKAPIKELVVDIEIVP